MDQIFLGNRYELHEEIGSGGMAHVFKARDTLLDRIVAIKILKPDYTEDTQFIERFRVEAKAAASLSNSSIVMIYDVGQDDGVYYIIMEYVDGITLKAYIANVGRIPWKEAVTLAVQMTQAIDSAHSNHIIHRDIKPQNILITRDRKIKITDFGIARAASTTTITTVGNAMGSVHYFSPEQAKGSLTDEKSDIYSLGITLYEMVTGVVPFEGETPIAVALKHIQEPPLDPARHNPQIPPGLSAIILKSIAKDKFNRYQSMGEMLSDLKKVMKDPTGETLQYASVFGGQQDWGGVYTNAGAYPNAVAYPNGGGYPNAGGYPREGDGYPRNQDAYPRNQDAYPRETGGYHRDSDFRDGRRFTGAYNPNAPAPAPYDERAAYNDRGQYGQRNGYVQNDYQNQGDYNGDYANNNGYNGDNNGYPDEGYNDVYEDGDQYAIDVYANGAAAPEDDMNGGNRRSNRQRGAQPRGGYPAQGNAGRARTGTNSARNRQSREYDDRRGGKKGRQRDDNDGERRGGSYTGVFVAVVLVAVLAAIGFVIWIMNNLFNVIQPPDVINRGDDDQFSVGNYIGSVYTDVAEELQAEGIRTQENRVPNDVVDEGVIVDQSIERGRILRKNGPEVIIMEVSDGARRFTVPDYREYGSDSRAAEAELRANSLAVSVVDEQNSIVPKGYVVRTEPGAGTQLAAGSQITIFRSLGAGSDQIIVPQLIGKTYRDALDVIDEARLTLGSVMPESTSATSIVIRQSLSPNTVVDEGVAIDLWFGAADAATEEETTTETTPEPSPEESPDPSPTPDPDATPGPDATPDPDATPEPGEVTTTEASTQASTPTTGQAVAGDPINMTISLSLPDGVDYDEIVKVLVEATPSDTGRTTRLLNRSVRRDDFPRNVSFTIPSGGTVEINVWYDGEFIQKKVFDGSELLD